MPIEKCPQCAGRNLVPGRLAGQFRPNEIAKVFALTGTVNVFGTACLNCGAVHLEIDPEKLASLTGQSRQADSEDK
jgi:hypothetical protein